MNALVGYTGFVGSNLYEKGTFDGVYNSKNIGESFGTNPDFLIYSGLSAEKYLANNAPEKDREQIVNAQENIRKINPKKLVLISTIDVFRVPKGVDETSAVETENLHAYGYNRYQLEQWVRREYQDALIVRLPGLFGKNIRKNFIYDYIHVIPFMLKKEKMDELREKDGSIEAFYEMLDNGFYRLKDGCTGEEKAALRQKFKEVGFCALHFTDSRSVYQFYPLARLWDDIGKAVDAGLTLFHPATEPVSAGELYRYLSGEEFVNELGGVPADYDYCTIHDGLFGGSGGYIMKKAEVLEEIRRFVNEEREKL